MQIPHQAIFQVNDNGADGLDQHDQQKRERGFFHCGALVLNGSGVLPVLFLYQCEPALLNWPAGSQLTALRAGSAAA